MGECLMIKHQVLHRRFWLALGSALILLSSPARAFEAVGGIDRRDPQDYDEYFKIESTHRIQAIGFLSVTSMASDFAKLDEVMQRLRLPLLKWRKVDSTPDSPAEDYDRSVHFGGWQRIGDTCVNIRAQVLIRDSKIPVQMRKSGCSVATGEWYDPYTDQTFTRADQLDVDHLVPLRNAYTSGGWKWDDKKRCRYSNFMKNPIHLVPVSATENRRKSDYTPADYLPPNQQFLCDYAVRWLKIKTIWGLVMMPPEAEAIQQIISQNQCDPAAFVLPESELEQSREAMETDPVCDDELAWPYRPDRF